MGFTRKGSPKLLYAVAGLSLLSSVSVSYMYYQSYYPSKQSPETTRTVPFTRRLPVTAVDCAALVRGDGSQTTRALQMAVNHTDVHEPQLTSFLSSPTTFCSDFLTNRGFITSALTDEEKTYPLAFGIVIYRDLDQFERLLRAIYRPQNFYCVHADRKSPEIFRQALRTLLSCFPNVFLSAQSVKVHWGTFSVLDADLICMRELLRFKWKYFINLTGQEFPLQTNKQLVQVLKAYRGANGIKGSVSRFDKRRVKNKGPPPFNITLMKGPVHIAASRAFVEFIFSDKKTQIFLEWLKDTVVPDETFYATINYNPHLSAPGGFNGPVQVRENMPFILRYKQWNGQKCSGKHVRDICIFNVGDLSDLANSKALFANKFHRTYGQYAYDCLEELHWNRTIQEYFSGEEFNTSFYSSLSETSWLAVTEGANTTGNFLVSMYQIGLPIVGIPANSLPELVPVAVEPLGDSPGLEVPFASER